jgi:hypothetical protein
MQKVRTLPMLMNVPFIMESTGLIHPVAKIPGANGEAGWRMYADLFQTSNQFRFPTGSFLHYQ